MHPTDQILRLHYSESIRVSGKNKKNQIKIKKKRKRKKKKINQTCLSAPSLSKKVESVLGLSN